MLVKLLRIELFGLQSIVAVSVNVWDVSFNTLLMLLEHSLGKKTLTSAASVVWGFESMKPFKVCSPRALVIRHRTRE